jgi:hypothetical protein
MTADVAKYLPDTKIWLRAAVSSIPVVGSALDHLVFDKADAIRTRNIEAAIEALSERLREVEEASIDRKWFESEEALAAMRLLADKASFEPNPRKVKDVGRLVAACGLHPQSKDPRKLSAVDHLSRLSPEQLRLLRIVAGVPAQKKTQSFGSISQTISGVWLTDIKVALEQGTTFWDGQLQLPLELDVLESLNVIRQIGSPFAGDRAYGLTSLGNHALSLLNAANL